MNCKACEAAQTNAYAGEYHAGCRQCEVRAVSNAPKSARDVFYRGIPEAERAQWKSDVLAEFGRRNSLIAQRVREAV